MKRFNRSFGGGDVLSKMLSEFAYGRSNASPDSEQIERNARECKERNSVSVEQIQDRSIDAKKLWLNSFISNCNNLLYCLGLHPRNDDLRSNFNAQSARNRLRLLASSHLNAKAAFTLAEVLITLGIIGVVAALTIPTLMTKYKIKVLETNFKHAYSIILNANTLMKKDYPDAFEPGAEFDRKEHLKRLQTYMPNSNLYETNLIRLGQRFAKPYVSFDNLPAFHCASYSPAVLMLNNGIAIEMTPWAVNGYCVDTNGPGKGPNKTGYDVFVFSMDKDKALVPYDRFGGCFNSYGTDTNYAGQAGNTCSIQALSNTCPDDSSKTYWQCLP